MTDDLPIRLVISNRGIANYHLAKCLAENLSPLGLFTHTIKST